MTTYFIEHQCPQCGAPVILEESDRLVKCQYCRVASYLIQNPYFRYLIPANVSEKSDLFYVPYWRFKGMLLSSTSDGIRHRFMDLSCQAVQSVYFPSSLGFRSQTQKLKFALPDNPGRFLYPTFSRENAMKIFSRRFSKNMPEPVYHQNFVGENLSIVYSPFYIKKGVVDGLLNKAVSERTSENFNLESFPGGPVDWGLKFLPALCPKCGWDLSGERDSLLLICKNCNTAWFSKNETLKTIKFATLKLAGNIFLPFWRIKVTVEGVGLDSFADLIRIANLPKIIKPEDHKKEFFFWSAAFKVPPIIFLRLNRNLTMAQPVNDNTSDFPSGHIHPVTLPVNEASKSMKINFASFACPPNHYLPLLPHIKIRPQKTKLVFIPFHEGHHELIQEKYGLTINKNQLRLSSNL